MDKVVDGSLRNITVKIIVGEPTPLDGHGGLAWRVPYDVTDDNGNRAVTTYREVRVKEVTLEEVELEAKRQVASKSSSGLTHVQNHVAHQRPSEPAPCPPCDRKEPPLQSQPQNESQGAEKTCASPSLPPEQSFPPMGFLVILLLLLLLVCSCLLLVGDAKVGSAPRVRLESREVATPQRDGSHAFSPPTFSPPNFSYSTKTLSPAPAFAMGSLVRSPDTSSFGKSPAKTPGTPMGASSGSPWSR
jgi:hypothetical protein